MLRHLGQKGLFLTAFSCVCFVSLPKGICSAWYQTDWQCFIVFLSNFYFTECLCTYFNLFIVSIFSYIFELAFSLLLLCLIWIPWVSWLQTIVFAPCEHLNRESSRGPEIKGGGRSHIGLTVNPSVHHSGEAKLLFKLQSMDTKWDFNVHEDMICNANLRIHRDNIKEK